ncbi:MAG: hypothetical protein PXY39_08365 [archaeon]|nr:hypothetical protein [archaeon]
MATENIHRWELESYKNLLDETELNLTIFKSDNPFQDKYRTDVFVSIRSHLHRIPQDLSDQARKTYKHLEEANYYTDKVLRLGLDEFKNQSFFEYEKWIKLRVNSLQELQDLQKVLKEKIEQIEKHGYGEE